MYLINVGIIVNNGFVYPYISHFWSLAIEEQFYLVWPFIVLFVPRLWIAGIAMVLLSTAYRFALVETGGNWLYAVTIMGNGDVLAIGALAAIACRRHGAAQVELWLRYALPLTFAAWLALVVEPVYPIFPTAISFSIGITPPCFFFAWLVVLAVHEGPEGNSWGGAVMPWLGRISYGIYVWHFILLWPVSLITGGPPSFWWNVAGVGATIAVSWLSYTFFEEPLRDVGKRLAFRVQSRARVTA